MHHPGEISLAHRGVLFLDELPEFGTKLLGMLRQPLEDRKLTISRSSGSLTFPANFMFVGELDPCPCGHPVKECTCSLAMVSRYQKRIPSFHSGQAPARCWTAVRSLPVGSTRGARRGAAGRVGKAVGRPAGRAVGRHA